MEVALLSGRSARLRLASGSSLEQLLLAAERELGVCIWALVKEYNLSYQSRDL